MPPCWVSGCRSLSSLQRPVLGVLDKFPPKCGLSLLADAQHCCPWASPWIILHLPPSPDYSHLFIESQTNGTSSSKPPLPQDSSCSSAVSSLSTLHSLSGKRGLLPPGSSNSLFSLLSLSQAGVGALLCSPGHSVCPSTLVCYYTGL